MLKIYINIFLPYRHNVIRKTLVGIDRGFLPNLLYVFVPVYLNALDLSIKETWV